MTFQVVDLVNKPVSNATVNVVFYLVSRIGERIQGTTDTNGLFTVESICIDYFAYGVEKEGYYQSHGKHVVISKDPDRLRDGKWLPWNSIIKVKLKPVRTPQLVRSQFSYGKIQEYGKPIGFDLFACDWVEPYGKGKIADILITCVFLETDWRRSTMCVEFPGEMNGGYLLQKDKFSSFMTQYSADKEETYKHFLRNPQSSTNDGYRVLTKDQYCVFRIRSQVNQDGNITSSFYGIINGPFNFIDQSKNKIRLSYSINPIANNTNLEFFDPGSPDGK